MGWWPKRSRAEKAQDIKESLIELALSVGVLAIGLLLILAGGYFETHDWLFFVGGGLALLGGYAVMQSIMGLVVEVSIGMAGAMAVLGLAILGYMLFNGYALLMQ